MIHDTRLTKLNDKPLRDGLYVLYWMQLAHRAVDNHALEYAAREANRLSQPMVVCAGVLKNDPAVNAKQYPFMLEGLAETQKALAKRGIAMVVRQEMADKVAIDLAREASLLVCDGGYLRDDRARCDRVADGAACCVVEVETNVIVPVGVVSDKQEYAARTIRPKLNRLLDEYLKPLQITRLKKRSTDMNFDGMDLSDVKPSGGRFVGGSRAGEALLEAFLSSQLNAYLEERSEPAADCVSHMSPYLHFGQVSPLTIAMAVQAKRGVSREAKDAYLEELIVRRELSFNFVTYNAGYDDYEKVVPAWARKTLAASADDQRDYVYTLDQWEQADTHDPYWNAAQREMVDTGFMHNYMRMYWGKKIIEWSRSPREAFATALQLNNQYELDGNDPNSFVGVGWCFGLHDRPWQRRAVFGTVRYMNANGLKRKCDIEAYVRKWNA